MVEGFRASWKKSPGYRGRIPPLVQIFVFRFLLVARLLSSLFRKRQARKSCLLARSDRFYSAPYVAFLPHLWLANLDFFERPLIPLTAPLWWKKSPSPHHRQWWKKSPSNGGRIPLLFYSLWWKDSPCPRATWCKHSLLAYACALLLRQGRRRFTPGAAGFGHPRMYS